MIQRDGFNQEAFEEAVRIGCASGSGTRLDSMLNPKPHGLNLSVLCCGGPCGRACSCCAGVCETCGPHLDDAEEDTGGK